MRKTHWMGQAALVISTLPVAGGALAAPAAENPIRPQAIQAHMNFLADDLLEGREAGTRGYDIAAKYVAAQFATLGLEHGAGNGSYFQNVPLRKSALLAESARLTIETRSGRKTYAEGEGVVIYPSLKETDQALQASVVFAGFGVVAPEFGLDAYADLDVKGRIVALLAGPPPGIPMEAAAHYASQKARTALSRGALGILLIYTPAREALFAFDRLRSTIGATISWVGPDGQPNEGTDSSAYVGIINMSAAKELFAGAPRSLDEVVTEANTRSPKGFPLDARISLTRRSAHETSVSANVLGLLPGSDPALSREIVVISTHLDHVGIGKPVNGDAIYNGALDNAVGVASTIEVARALVEGSPRPKRTILFAAVTAEEKGLIGSDYFAHHPSVSKDRIVANINFDGALALFDFSDIVGYGSEHSTLGRSVEQVADQMGLLLSPDPYPNRGTFTGSDHYSFVQQGVPAIFLLQGVGKQADGRLGKDVWDSWMSTHYHQPSDDMKQAIDFGACAKFAEVYRRLLLQVANAPDAPRWYAGDVFGERFAPDAPKAAPR
jgi:hypothetical protein